MTRTAALVAGVRAAYDALVTVVEAADLQRWSRVPAPGVWSAGKDAEHVAAGAARHLWIVRRSIGEKVASRPPPVERAILTTPLAPAAMAALLRQRADEAATLLATLTDEQLDRPVRPPRPRNQSLGDLIGPLLIGHVNSHRGEIEAKLRA